MYRRQDAEGGGWESEEKVVCFKVKNVYKKRAFYVCVYVYVCFSCIFAVVCVYIYVRVCVSASPRETGDARRRRVLCVLRRRLSAESFLIISTTAARPSVSVEFFNSVPIYFAQSVFFFSSSFRRRQVVRTPPVYTRIILCIPLYIYIYAVIQVHIYIYSNGGRAQMSHTDILTLFVCWFFFLYIIFIIFFFFFH